MKALRLFTVLALLSPLAGGCALMMPALQGHHETLRDRIHRAKTLGAMVCASVDLAQAQTAYRFATLELDQGDGARAAAHVQEGLTAVDRAIAAGQACEVRGLSPKEQGLDPWEDADADGVADAADACPYALEDFDEYQDEDGCPEPDNDLDGLLDVDDPCPNEAEDLDGFGDEDGCPEPDNDMDGVLDADDQCPAEAENHNGVEDTDGCPEWEPHYLVVAGTLIAFHEALAFVDTTAELDETALPALRELAQLIGGNPGWRLRIEGHTHSLGEMDQLKDWSLARAASVRSFLVQSGVAGGRLKAVGLGPEHPIDTNRTSAGRRQNLRIEVHVEEEPRAGAGGGAGP